MYSFSLLVIFSSAVAAVANAKPPTTASESDYTCEDIGFVTCENTCISFGDICCPGGFGCAATESCGDNTCYFKPGFSGINIDTTSTLATPSSIPHTPSPTSTPTIPTSTPAIPTSTPIISTSTQAIPTTTTLTIPSNTFSTSLSSSDTSTQESAPTQSSPADPPFTGAASSLQVPFYTISAILAGLALI